MELGNSIFNGIISGVIASLCFAIFLLLIKPRVKIAKQICIDRDRKNNVVHQIKIVNRSHAMITDLKYVLYYCVMHGDGISTSVEIQPRKSRVIIIDRIRLISKNADYAARITYDIDPQHYPLNDNCKLVFMFIAKHSLSNTSKCIKREYYSKDIIEGTYESGKSVKIIRNHQ